MGILDLSKNKRALLEQLRRDRGLEPSDEIERLPVGAAQPLSSGQRRLWFLEQLEPGSAFYNMPGAVTIEGPLSVDTLERALDEVVRRHEVLRTTFVGGDGRPAVVVQGEAHLHLDRVDLRALSSDARAEAIAAHARLEANTPFALDAAPLVRAKLLREADERHALLLTMHHIVSDGWSIGIFVREVALLYAAFSSGAPSPLAPLKIQYGDYAAWQERQLSKASLEPQLRHWRDQLADAPPLLRLPTDRPRPAKSSYRGASVAFSLAPAPTSRLRALAQREGATLYMALLAGFQLLLARYSGERDIVVGSPVAGRGRSETTDLIGFFVNTLVLRARLHGEPTFRRFVGHVREVVLGALAHQDVPFERLVQELSPEREPGRHPLFQVMFAMQEASVGPWQLGELRLEPFPLDTGTSKFDLTLVATEVDGGIEGHVEYSTDLFDRDTVVRMAGHLTRLLEEASQSPDEPALRLDFLSSEERRRILDEWNETQQEAPATLDLREMFEARVATQPDATALSSPRGIVTYAELDARAERLAATLTQLGLRVGDRVALCAPRSIELVIAILATLKAGGAYVPLDPSYPADRLAFMIRDSGASFVLSTSDRASGFQGLGPQVALLDGDLGGAPRRAPRGGRRGAAEIAYVIYTSGSTGLPKGVAITHESAANLVNWHLRALELQPSDRSTLVASPSFDASVWELWPALAAGASLSIPEDEVRTDSHSLLSWFEREQVTVSFVPTQLAEAMLEDDGPWPPSLRRLTAAGEALHRRPSPGASFVLVNAYGPTENTVATTTSIVSDERSSTMPSIGRPISNVRTYVLDPWLEPVPVGARGELCVAGEGLAVGYWNRPRETAASFVPDPRSTRGERLYLTGDLARYSPDGDLHYLGRKDHQIKLRGFRIETGEVEAALARHPGVREAVVVLREDTPGGARLVAYVVPREGVTLEPLELRAQLQERLPEHMVPAAFVSMSALPLSTSGKVARARLPAPDAAALATSAYAPPRDRIERAICDIWREVLGVDRVGIHDEFFHLGGHSLLATQVASRLRRELGVDLPLATLFEATTIASLADRVRAAGAVPRVLESLPIERVPRGESLVLSFGQERLWFLDQLEPKSSFYNLAGAIRLSGPFEESALRKALDEVVARHEALRFSFVDEGGIGKVRICDTPRFVLETVLDSESWSDSELQADLTRRALRPFDLGEDSLFRACLLAHRGTRVLLLVVHHIVSDWWSLVVLIRETVAVYLAALRGSEAVLPDLPLGYPDFADWQRRLLAAGHLDPQIGHWKRQLAGAPPALELPSDRPRPEQQRFRGATLEFAVPTVLERSLRELALKEGTTLYMLLSAAFDVFLHRLSGATDVVVGTPIANRTWRELEGIVGFFVNTLAIRARIDVKSSFRELMLQIKSTTLASYDAQDVPFERVVEELNPPRDLSRSPIFQHFFSLQPGIDLTLGDADTRVELVTLQSATAKFDLSLAMSDVAGKLQGTFEYATDLFDASTIERWCSSFVVLLESIVREPGAAIEDLEFLSRAERQQLVTKNNLTEVSFGAFRHLHEMVEAQSSATPDAVAVVHEGAVLTHRELDERANQLAHHLSSLGVGPASTVGVFLHRCLELPLVLLAILKAGAAYVPLEPDHPVERLRHMLGSSGCSLVVSDSRASQDLLQGDVGVLLLDESWESIAARPRTRPSVPVSPDSLAYVIFTSGSTGLPKGAAISHAGICNRLLWMQAEYGLGPADAVLQKTPYGFDVSVWEFFWPLITGARLVMARPGGHRDAAYLVSSIQAHCITTLHFVPSMARAFLEEPGLDQLVSLKRVMCSGEALGADLVREFLGALRVEVHNLYGPTEASVDVTAWSCTDEVFRRASVPIGRPIANTTTYVVDERLAPRPTNATGELLLGGVQLARGYLGRPGLTAERFVPDPFSTRGGERLYRTGDLARWADDGVLEYLGRLDHQVKIRGFRIELDEIKAQLLLHPQVRDAAVIARRNDAGVPSISAYVVPHAGPVAEESLRLHLARMLPEYMVPAAFLMLEALPLTPSGKLDTKALPSPEVRSRVGGAHAEPETPEERRLVELWKSVLKVPRVGIDDNFFDLGGDSILTIRVRARAAAEGLQFSVHDLFKHQTVRSLASALRGVDPGAPPAPGTGSLLSVEDRDALPPGVVDAYPLPRVMAGLVFHSEFSPDYLVYSYSVHLRGRMDADLLRAVARRVAGRHPILRTAFDLGSFSEPVQLVRAEVDVPVTETDLRHLVGDDQERWIVDWLAQEQRTRFDWSTAPLLRLHLHRRSADTFQFTLSQPFLDGWSAASLLAELAGEAFGLAPTSPPTSTPRDFVVLEREAQNASSTRAFWDGQLEGRHVLELLKRSGPPVGEPPVGRIAVPLSASVEAGLRGLAARAGVPLKDVCLAAHMKVLQILGGSRDVTSGVLFNGRPEEIDGDRVLGMFLNPLPFRVVLRPGTWSDLAQQVMRAEIDILPHRRFPLVELQRGRGQLFDVLFNFIHFHVLESLAALRGTLEPLSWDYGSDQDYVPLITRFSIEHDTKRLTLTLEYRSAQLEGSEVTRIASYYGAVLDAMGSDPEGSHDVSCLPESERRRVVVDWNQTKASISPLAVHRLFEVHAENQPDRIAVVCGDEHISYGELDRRAAELARLLRRDLRGGSLVGVCIPRSVDMVVAILAVLKAGAAYVPLDASYPPDRLSHMIEDSGLEVLLTHREVQHRVATEGLRTYCVDDPAGLPSSGGTLPTTFDPEQPAYVIYTSGSTGKPKGVQVSHRALANFLASMAQAPGFGRGDVLVAVTSLSFDIAGLEIWLPLTAGGQVVIATQETTSDGFALAELVERSEPTVLQATPSTWRMLIEAGWTGSRALIALCGGEALEPTLAEELRRRVVQLWNMYGPTETTIWSTIDRVEGDVTVGRPIANTTTFVLDEGLWPVPVGVVGELLIGGEGLAAGYLGRPALTAERFVPDPFEFRSGARLYRTGDLARHREDGTLECLGRVDHQVKLRGFRIELGEIEAVLARQASVRECVVVAREDSPGAKRLVAYVASSDPAPSGEDLQASLRAALPEYMVPTSFVFVERLPRTLNGKIDRKALPAPDSHPARARDHVAPSTDLERELAELWAELLRTERVGVHDDFFELGGHSLTATQLVNRLRRRFDVDLPVRSLFEARTIAALAVNLQRALATPTPARAAQSLQAITKVDRGGRRMLRRPDGEVVPSAERSSAKGTPPGRTKP